jgi:RimJ/RimL family protein N-acetyltransferase
MEVEVSALLPSESSASLISNWLNDPLVNKYLESRFECLSPFRQFQLMNMWNLDESFLYLGIYVVESANSKLIGTIKFGPYNSYTKEGEIGIMIGDKNFWNRGIATLAISKAEVLIINNFKNIQKISCGVYESNSSSISAFLKNEFIIKRIVTNPNINPNYSSVIKLEKIY